MKKLLAILVAGAIAGTVAADITQWRFTGGTAQDQGAATDAWTMIFVQGNESTVSALISGGQIDENALDALSLTALGTSETAKLVFQPSGTLQTSYIISDGSAAGSMFGLLVNTTGITSISDIATGDYIGLTGDFTITDLQPGGTGTVGLPQDFNPGTVNANVSVVPEPATIGLFGLGALSAWIIRRNKIKATEEA